MLYNNNIMPTDQPEPRLIVEARLCARKAHRGQKRAGNGKPYITHPEAVARLTEANHGSVEAIAASYLHDVVEDTDVSIDDFPERVQELVQKLTHTAGHTKIDAIMRLRGDREAILIKLCDRFHNLNDVTSKRDKYVARQSVRAATQLLMDYAEEVNLQELPVYQHLRELLGELEIRNS